MSDPILTRNVFEGWVDRLITAAVRGDTQQFDYERDILAHDAALRSRLAEVEAERDEWKREAERLDLCLGALRHDEDECDQAQDALAEAIELLRDNLAEGTVFRRRAWEARARAFIEAHGEGA